MTPSSGQGFPSNHFGEQEPGPDVNGDAAQPLFTRCLDLAAGRPSRIRGDEPVAEREGQFGRRDGS